MMNLKSVLQARELAASLVELLAAHQIEHRLDWLDYLHDRLLDDQALKALRNRLDNRIYRGISD